jgi:hypothetical protein
VLHDMGDLLIGQLIGEPWHLRASSRASPPGLSIRHYDAFRWLQKLWHLTNYTVGNSHLTMASSPASSGRGLCTGTARYDALENDLATPAREITSRHKVDR